jgi:hypothetical protein
MPDVGGGPAVSLVEAPELADIYRALVRRPYWQATQPFAVSPRTWRAAQEQLAAVMRKRGWPLLADAETSRKGIANFLLYGVPIVMGD